MTDGELCLLCQANNKRSYLHSYQINLDEAIVLCENPQCSYPVGSTNYCVTYSRSFSHIEVPKPKDVGPSVPEAQVALQTRMAGYTRSNAKMFRSVIGTQTDQRPNSRSNIRSGNVLGTSKTTKSNKIPLGSDTRNGPITNGNPLQSCTSNHSKPIKKLNGLTNGTYNINGHANKVSNSADRISPTSSIDSNEVKTFRGFSFSTTNNQQRHTSKSEPPRRKLNPNTVHGALNNKTQAVSGNQGLVKDIRTGQNTIVKDSANNGRSSSCSNSSTNSSKHRTALLKQAKRIFSYPKKFIQWRNQDALCWLDAVLCLLVHNRHVNKIVFSDSFDQDSIVFKLLKAHKQAQELLETIKADNVSVLFSSKNRQSEIPPEILTISSSQDGGCKALPKVEMKLVSRDGSLDVKTGAGKVQSGKILVTSSNSNGAAELNDSFKASQIEEEMISIREHVWHTLQPKLKFERGRNDSPVFTMSSLIRENPLVEKLFKLGYSCWVQCSKCGYAEQESYEKVLPTLPAVVTDFQITEPSHTKSCALCGFSDARRTMVYEELSDCLLMHFTEGLPHSNWKKLDFDYHGNLYTLTGVVQYINNPDHFIAWLRDPTGGEWLRCDDLQPPVCTFQSQISVPPGQIHMVMWEKVPVQRQSSQNRIKMQNLATEATRNPSLQVNGDVGKERLDNNLLSNAFTALKVHEFAQNGNMGKADFGNKPNLIDSCQVIPASGNTSVNTRVSEIPSGRFNVPKETGSSSLSSTCSDLSEDLPEFAALPPTVPIVRPVPCHSSVPNSSNGESGEMNFGCSNAVKAAKAVNESDKAYTEKKTTVGITGVGEASSRSDSLNFPGVRLCGQKSKIQPSTVFCAPKSDEKKESDKEGTVIYPPFSVQKNPSDKKAGSIMTVSNSIPSSEAVSNSSKESVKQIPLNNLQPFVAPMKIEDKDGKKADVNKFTPAAHKLDKRRSLFTYMRRNRPNAPVNRKDAFMTLNVAGEKSKSEAQLNSTLSSAVPINQLTADSNISFLGKVQQYLLNNKVGFGDTKFDGMMLKSRSEAAIDHMVIGMDKRSSGVDTASSCNSQVVSPMSEWFGRKVNSPTRSAYSTNIHAMKRKSLTETVRQGKKARNEAVIVNGQVNGNHALGHVIKPIANVNGNNTILMNSAVIGNVQQATEINGQNELKNVGVQETSDCVLQDLYDALNIPFEDVGSTMANIMSDVDDILDFMKPSELTPGLPGTAPAALPARHISGQLAFSNG